MKRLNSGDTSGPLQICDTVDPRRPAIVCFLCM